METIDTQIRAKHPITPPMIAPVLLGDWVSDAALGIGDEADDRRREGTAVQGAMAVEITGIDKT